MATVGIRKVDASKMFKDLLHVVDPQIQKVTVVRRYPDLYTVTVRVPHGKMVLTGQADSIMKDVVREVRQRANKEEEE